MAELLEALSSSSQVGESVEASSSASSSLDSSSASRDARRNDPADPRKDQGAAETLRAIPFPGFSASARDSDGHVVERPRVGLACLMRVYFVLLLETLGRRRFARIASARMRAERLVVHGSVPRGGVVLAANHYPDRGCLGVVSAVLEASARTDDFDIVVGDNARTRDKARWVLRPIVAATRWVIARWTNLLVRVPTGNGTPRIDALRAWRRRAAERCLLVFPEGRMRQVFEPVRPGAGRWLRSLGCPTVPVAVFRTDGAWHVHFGSPIAWTTDRSLADAQLGLSIASMLPRELARGWEDVLGGWQRAHRAA